MSKQKNIKHRDGFTFFKSYDDVMQNLNDKQFTRLMRTLLDVQFLRIKYEEVIFNDQILDLVWSSLKYNISSQIEGYLINRNKNESLFLGVYDDKNGGSNGVFNSPSIEPSNEEQVQGQVQEEYINLEKDFQGIWVDYTLDFLKKKKRGGGNKQKALLKYKKAIDSGLTSYEIKKAVDLHRAMEFGWKDLERLLDKDFIHQILEDDTVVIYSAQHYDTNGNPIKGNFQ